MRGVNAEDTKIEGHNQRVHRGYHRRTLCGIQRAAEASPRQQIPRRVARFPGVNMVGIHQVFEIWEWNRGQAERQSHENHQDQQPARGRPIFGLVE